MNHKISSKIMGCGICGLSVTSIGAWKLPCLPVDPKNVNVELDVNGCLQFPNISSGLSDGALNQEYLREIGQLCRDGQTVLDRIPTNNIDKMLNPATSIEERQVFQAIEKLNAEVVTRILMIRRLVTAAMIGV
jgi:hypothetical protein